MKTNDKKNVAETSIEQAFKQINGLADRGRLKRALLVCRELSLEFPDHPRVLHGLGLLLCRCGERQEGESLIRRSIEIKPDYADAYFNLGNFYRHAYKLEEAEQLLLKALEIDPSHVKALSSLALLLAKRKKYREALEYCKKAIELNQRLPEAFIAKGSIMVECGETESGLELFRKALKLKKNNDGHSGLIFLMNLVPHVSQAEIFNETVAWSKRYADPLTASARAHLNTPLSERKIRVGYVSGDFKLHPVSHHLKPILQSHDAKRFAVYLYNNFAKTDEMTEEFAGYCNGGYRDISSLDDIAAEKIIRDDGIDILVDLAGHTAYHRLTLFARKPAPIQVTWLGYFNTTGMKAMDYLLSDLVTLPLGDDCLFREKIVRLPNCRFCYTAPYYAPNVAESPVLQSGFITFGSFNKLAKTNHEVIELWARVLNAVALSRLIIKWPAIDDDTVIGLLVQRFAVHGISRDRLIFRSDTPHPKMLAEYGDVDIALDTFPFNGGATTCEALWMGVPVVTLEGQTPISRQSKAFLHAIGHQEWVAKTADEYVTIATALAGDVERLTEIRAGLRQEFAASPLCDGKVFTHELEAAYRTMWKQWCHMYPEQSVDLAALRRFTANELYNAAVISMGDADYSHARNLLVALTKRQSCDYMSWNNLGICSFSLGFSQQAIKEFKRAIRLNKNDGKAYNNLGRLLLELGQKKLALSACRSAVRLSPDHIDSLLNLGVALRENGKISLASEVFERVLILDDSNSAAMFNLANLFLKSGMAAQSVEMLDRAIRIDPNNLDALSTRAFYLQNLPASHHQDVFQAGVEYNRVLADVYPGASHSLPTSALSDGRKLRVGFVSADFKSHPVGFLLFSFLENYDRSRLSIFCYHNTKKFDSISHRLRSCVEHWCDCTELNDEALHSQILSDGIDILIDLSGHTFGHRLAVFHSRAAPVQASWLGYGHTTGVKNMDYIIADSDFIDQEDEKWFTESVMRLPYNRFCFTPPQPSPEVVWPPFEDNGYITFGSFNDLSKLNPEVLDVWSAILHKVPHSKLLLKAIYFDDVAIRKRFKAEFCKRGISSRRLELRQGSNHYFMLAEYADIDIALDPFPFSGGMTSLEALWMGVPIITLPGELPISRQTASYLGLIGIPGLVATSKNDYLESAVSLACDTDRIKRIRESLRDAMSSSELCDAGAYARNFEQMLFLMWNVNKNKN